MGIPYGTKMAAAQIFKRLAQQLARAIQCSYLDHAAMLASRSYHLLAFPDVIRKRLLNINILACLTCPDRRQRVPMIGCSDHHGVDRLVVENSSQIGVSRNFFAPILEWLEFAFDESLIRVAQRYNARSGN